MDLAPRARAQAGYAIEQHLLEISRITMKINVAKESHRLEAPVADLVA